MITNKSKFIHALRGYNSWLSCYICLMFPLIILVVYAGGVGGGGGVQMPRLSSARRSTSTLYLDSNSKFTSQASSYWYLLIYI